MSQQAAPNNARDVPNYLIASILMTVCCFLPGGIAAVVFSVRAKTKAEMGDFDGAFEDARTSKKILWVSPVIGIALNIGLIALGVGDLETSP